MVDIQPKRICPDCESKYIKIVEGEMICGKCGLVVSEVFFAGNEMIV